jgi:hypothetical protein
MEGTRKRGRGRKERGAKGEGVGRRGRGGAPIRPERPAAPGRSGPPSPSDGGRKEAGRASCAAAGGSAPSPAKVKVS